MTETMEKLLKQARLDKDLKIEDVTRELKIRKDHLRKFERKIPDPLGVYELGYLRSYANYLGVGIHDYIEERKERANALAQENNNTNKNKIFKVIKTPTGLITIAISIVAVIASVVFLEVTGKTSIIGMSYQDSSALTRDENMVNVSSETSSSVEKQGPYDYLVKGIGRDGEINIIARVNTTFTMIDPVRNKIVSRGAVVAGGRLFVPKDQDSKIFTSLLIKTNVPDAFDVQKNTQGE